MTIHEFAALFGLSKHTVHTYVKRGILPRPEGPACAARYGRRHVEAMRAWRALQHTRVSGAEVVAFCREEGISLPEYVRRRERRIATLGMDVA